MSPRCALYVPGSRPDRFDKAAASGADVVILDLEDSVADPDKAAARAAVADWCPRAPVPVQVRVNAPGSPDLAADLRVLGPDVELRLPKVSAVQDLRAVVDRRVHAILESTAGVEHAYAIAQQPCVRSLALGEADLAAELGLEGDEGFAWIRSRVVVAARAAGLPAPMMSVYPEIPDLDGLSASCHAGRRLGMRGRTAIHPRQVPVIREAFGPGDRERVWAEEVVAAMRETGVTRLRDGSMVDAAMLRRARAILDDGCM